jgi:hypothetical protein
MRRVDQQNEARSPANEMPRSERRPPESISRSSHIMGKRFGLGRDAIFRLWKAAIKDDERLLDEAIAETYERMVRVDPVRAEEVVSLTIRRPTVSRTGRQTGKHGSQETHPGDGRQVASPGAGRYGRKRRH